MPRAGGDCFTIIRSMGPGVGTVAGLLSWFSLAMKSTFALLGMSVFLNLVVQVDVTLAAVAFCLLFLFINLIGIREAGRVQVAFVIGLLSLMLIYSIRGVPHVNIEYFSPFAPGGGAAIFSTAGFVFVSYAGLLKIASVAEEIKNPARTIPTGMILSLLVVSILYVLMIFVTAGVLDPRSLHGSLTPVSDAAGVFMGRKGKTVMSIAAVLAFLSTANAGIMTAARSLVPLSRDNLFPAVFGNIGRRFQTPHNALLLTASFIILSLFLKLEVLVEVASVVLVLTNILACLALVFLRESYLQNYQPRFRAPLYPWLQIAGIIGLVILLFEMGKEALLLSLVFIVAGTFTYWFYGRIRSTREYALLHLVERVTSRKLVSGSLESELKQIIRERDQVVNDRFDDIVERCVVLDIGETMTLDEFFRLAAKTMEDRLHLDRSTLLNLFLEKEGKYSSVLIPGLAIPHIVIEGEHLFDVLLARSRDGILFYRDNPPVHAVFILVGTRDERNFHLRALAAIAQIVQDPRFEEKWSKARNVEGLRDIVLLGERRRDR